RGAARPSGPVRGPAGRARLAGGPAAQPGRHRGRRPPVGARLFRRGRLGPLARPEDLVHEAEVAPLLPAAAGRPLPRRAPRGLVRRPRLLTRLSPASALRRPATWLGIPASSSANAPRPWASTCAASPRPP